MPLPERDAALVLLAGDDGVLTPALCQALLDAGFRPLVHGMRQGSPCAAIAGVERLPDQPLLQWLRADPRAEQLQHVVFGLPAPWPGLPGSDPAVDVLGAIQAADALAALAQPLQQRLDDFLLELQAVARLLCRRDDAQLWVLTPDEAMRYHLPLGLSTIETHARHAAVRSLAKEVFRFGLRVNCAVVQHLEEQSPAADWAAARDGLKAFVMRFKANTAAPVARMLAGWLREPKLPMAGVVVPLGVGVLEGNL